MRVFSYGAGTQSTAALILAAEGKIDFPTFLFANVGEDSENPDTFVYMRDYALPYAAAHGIVVEEVGRVLRDGTTITILEDIMRPSRSINIPVRMANGAPGHRNCTETFKIKPIAKWLKAHGATKDDPAVLAVGISLDEIGRSRSASGYPHIIRCEPLIDLRLTRGDCSAIIRRAGLPLPPKSSCTFCPFHTKQYWKDQKQHSPDRFALSVQVEERLNEKRELIGKDAVYLTSWLRPLSEAVGDATQDAFDLDALDMCESGFCMT